MSNVVSRWLAEARALMNQASQNPLIDDEEIDMRNELVGASMFGDEGLRDSIESRLATDPNDEAMRFVALTPTIA